MKQNPQTNKGAESTPESINQQKIADMLGISRATVSRCFTNHPGINPVTRAKVFDLASQLGYQYMEMRVAEKRKELQLRRVGVLVCTDLEEYFRGGYESPGLRLYAGASECAQVSNLSLEIHYVEPKETSLDDPSYAKLTRLRKRDWDGILLIYPFPRTIVDELERRFPMVSLVEQYGTAAVNCVDVDHYKGIAIVMNKMKSLGHERIGFYTRRYEVEAQWSYRRYSAYVEKMTRWELPVLDSDVVGVGANRMLGREEGFEHVAARIRDGVTGWVCAADHQAYDLILGLQRLGIEIPKHASITGFDGIHKPDEAPLLATAVVPSWEIGYTAVKRLLETMHKRSGLPHHVLISPQFREGETLGPAPGAASG